MTYDDQLEAIHGTMQEPADTAELQIERRVDALVRELDELMAMAANHETVDLIEHEKIGIGQCATRCQLILSFLAARKPPQLRMIRNA
jgi:hypothetical protein